MRTLIVHFVGGTEVSLETDADPQVVYDALAGEEDWLIVQDVEGGEHYLAVEKVAYLAFNDKKGIGFA